MTYTQTSKMKNCTIGTQLDNPLTAHSLMIMVVMQGDGDNIILGISLTLVQESSQHLETGNRLSQQSSLCQDDN